MKKIGLILLIAQLIGCTQSFVPLNAPCNERAVHCGEKIKINSW